MNHFVHHQHQEYDPSSLTQESYNQFTNNCYSYSYSYPNPQFSGSIHPYSYQNPFVQPSQHEEQEPNPPGVTPTPPPPPPPPPPYYQYHAHGAAAGVPTAAPQLGAMDTGVQTVVNQPVWINFPPYCFLFCILYFVN